MGIDVRDDVVARHRLGLRDRACHASHLIDRECRDAGDPAQLNVVLGLETVTPHEIPCPQSRGIGAVSLGVELLLRDRSHVSEDVGDIGLEGPGVLAHGGKLGGHAGEVGAPFHDGERRLRPHVLGDRDRLVGRPIPAHGEWRSALAPAGHELLLDGLT